MFRLGKDEWGKFLDPLYHESTETKQAFEAWDRSAQISQIRAVALLTAVLYVLFFMIDRMVLTDYVQAFAIWLHLYFLVPILLFIALLTYIAAGYRVLILLLSFAPVLANFGNVFLSGMLYNSGAVYLAELFSPEIYLSVIWIFAISGLRFRYALASASVSSLASLAYTLFYVDMPTESLYMHTLWMVSAFSFGVLSALLLSKKNKQIFLHSRKLERLATTDMLSGLCNRMQMQAWLEAEIKRAERYARYFSIILIDLDHFKAINDTYGHNEGDRVIQTLSRLLASSIREADRVGRWGGEEFLVLLPETAPAEAIIVAEDIRLLIAQSDFSPVPLVHVSAGVTGYREGDSLMQVVQRADEALYQAKENGRNQVCWHA